MDCDQVEDTTPETSTAGLQHEEACEVGSQHDIMMEHTECKLIEIQFLTFC